MLQFKDIQPHGKIIQVFKDVFIVMGTNIYKDIQTSRNMIIIRDKDELTLINTVRLNEASLTELSQYGMVKNIIRLGAFHGYDDPFYLDRYKAILWVVKGMEREKGYETASLLETNKPLNHCTLFNFEDTVFPEGALLLERSEGNILITCDSIQNWTRKDEFFSDATFDQFKQEGHIQAGNMPTTWINACKPPLLTLKKLKDLEFKHLLSAHGDPLINTAYETVCNTLKQKFNID